MCVFGDGFDGDFHPCMCVFVYASPSAEKEEVNKNSVM